MVSRHHIVKWDLRNCSFILFDAVGIKCGWFMESIWTKVVNYNTWSQNNSRNALNITDWWYIKQKSIQAGQCFFKSPSINTNKPPSHLLICSVSHSGRWDSVVLLVCRLVCRLWLKSDNRSVGHSCWPTFLPQLHCVYHQGLLACSGLAPDHTLPRHSDPPALPQI